MKKHYYNQIKIVNKQEWKRHVEKVIGKHKIINPNICNNPTDEFINEIMDFNFEYDYIPISRLYLMLSSVLQNLLQILKCHSRY